MTQQEQQERYRDRGAGRSARNDAQLDDDAQRGYPHLHHRKALHGGEGCYANMDDATMNDPSSGLAYYRAIYDFLRTTDFDPQYSRRVGSVEVVRAGSLPGPLSSFASPSFANEDPADGGGGGVEGGHYSQQQQLQHPPTDVAILPITSVLAFSASRLDPTTGQTILFPRGNTGISSYGDIAGLLLGMHHFNNGIGSVVPELNDIHRRCPIRFVADFHDSESSQATAVDIVTRQIIENPDRPPAALFGAWRSAVSVPLAILGGIYSIPQMSPLSTSTELDDVTQYTHFTRLIPSDAGTARAVVDYFRQISPDLRHLGVLYVNDAYGSAFHQAIKESAQAIEPEEDRINVKGSPFSYSNSVLNPDEINLAVSTLAKTGYRIFFGVFYDEHFDLVMKSAVKFGIAGPGYVWIVSDGLTESYLNGKSYPAGSDLAIASQGVGILKAEGGRETTAASTASNAVDVDGGDGDATTTTATTGYDRFVDAWYSQTDEMAEYYNCVGHPATNTMDDPSIYYQAEPGFFEERRLSPTAGATFIYDSVVALGLAACELLDEERQNQEQEEGGGGEEENEEEDGGGGNGQRRRRLIDSSSSSLNGTLLGTTFDGNELFEAVTRQTFEGASGNVLIDPATTSRDPKSAFFVLYNAHGTTSEEEDGSDGMTTFTVETVSHSSKAEGVNTSTIEWVSYQNRQFVYSDGTTTFPAPLPPLQHNMNYLSPGVRGAGLALAGVVFACSVFFSFWTFRHRNTRIVKASQPMFLHKITAGTIVMGGTIITLSIDDGVASQRGCDVACMLNPWLFSYGFVIAFSALFSKTWRINKIFHNPSCKRIKVTIKDVILPFLVMFILNTIVLSVWTAVSPLRWERIPLEGEDRFGRPIESYGTCMAPTKDWAPYVTVILILNFTMVVLANVQAYQARKITTEYAESKFVGIIMASILQAVCIGLPLVVLSADEPAANFIVRAGIIFVICMSMLLLMFVPKMHYLKEWRAERANKERLKMERADARKKAMERAVAMGYTTSAARRAAGGGGGSTLNKFRESGGGGGGAATAGAAMTGTTVRLSLEHRRVSELGMGDLSSHGEDDGGDEGSSAKKPATTTSDDSKAEGIDDGAVHPPIPTNFESNGSGPNQEEEALKKVLEDDDGAGQKLEVDEELAIIDAASTGGGAKWGMLRNAWHSGALSRRDVAEEESITRLDSSDLGASFSMDDSASSFSTSTHDGEEGIRIMNHPKAESREVRLLKAQVDQMKLEKLALHDRLRALRALLKDNGVAVNDEELESLTGMSRDSNRRLNPRIVDDNDATRHASDPLKRILNRVSEEASYTRGEKKPGLLQKAKTVRFGPGIKSLAFGANKSRGADGHVAAEDPEEESGVNRSSNLDLITDDPGGQENRHQNGDDLEMCRKEGAPSDT